MPSTEDNVRVCYVNERMSGTAMFQVSGTDTHAPGPLSRKQSFGAGADFEGKV